MASISEYAHYDGLGLAELVRTRKVSPEELCREAIRRAEKLNPVLNAINLPLYEPALEKSRKDFGSGPFAGVPFLVKDAHHALEGVPMSSGSRLLKNHVPAEDAEIVKRFRAIGLNIIGKTNTPEFKLATVTEPEAFGPTRNPWNPDYTAGGSSGGSAAATAAGIVPFASGTDEGGSIRIPSACCGLFGLKPSRGRNPVGPDFNLYWDGMSTSHVITRSVRDSAAILDAVCGPEPGAPDRLDKPDRSYLESLNHIPGELKIAYHIPQSAFGEPVHAECALAVKNTAELLENLGHRVEEVDAVYAEEDAAFNWLLVMIGNLAAQVSDLCDEYGVSNVRRHIEIQNFAMYRLGTCLKTPEFVRARRNWLRLGLTLDRFFTGYDLLLTPVLGKPPVAVGSQAFSLPDRIALKIMASAMSRLIFASNRVTRLILETLFGNVMKGQLPFTMIANITGLPAMSVPLHWTAQGIPCGVQFIGPSGDEVTLLRLAAQLEAARPWFDRVPEMA